MDDGEVSIRLGADIPDDVSDDSDSLAPSYAAGPVAGVGFTDAPGFDLGRPSLGVDVPDDVPMDWEWPAECHWEQCCSFGQPCGECAHHAPELPPPKRPRNPGTRIPRSEEFLKSQDVGPIKTLLMSKCTEAPLGGSYRCPHGGACLQNLLCRFAWEAPSGPRPMGLSELIEAVQEDRACLFRRSVGGPTVSDLERQRIFSHAMMSFNPSDETVVYRGVPMCLPSYFAIRWFTRHNLTVWQSPTAFPLGAVRDAEASASVPLKHFLVDRRRDKRSQAAPAVVRLTLAQHYIGWFVHFLKIIGTPSLDVPGVVTIGRVPLSAYFATFRAHRPWVHEGTEPNKKDVDYFGTVIKRAFVDQKAEPDELPAEFRDVNLPKVQLHGCEVGKCVICEELIREMGCGVPERSSVACDKMFAHKQHIAVQAQAYQRVKSEARRGKVISVGVDAINTKTTRLVWFPDGVSQSTLPECIRMPGFKVTNAVIHNFSGKKFTLRLISTPWLSPNANLQLTQWFDHILPFVLSQFDDDVRCNVLHVQFDRASDNLCATSLAFFTWLVHKCTFHEIFLCMLPVGHSHEDFDLAGAILKHWVVRGSKRLANRLQDVADGVWSDFKAWAKANKRDDSEIKVGGCGALSPAMLLDLLRAIDDSEAVMVERALDFEQFFKDFIDPELKYYREPLNWHMRRLKDGAGRCLRVGPGAVEVRYRMAVDGERGEVLGEGGEGTWHSVGSLLTSVPADDALPLVELPFRETKLHKYPRDKILGDISQQEGGLGGAPGAALEPFRSWEGQDVEELRARAQEEWHDFQSRVPAAAGYANPEPVEYPLHRFQLHRSDDESAGVAGAAEPGPAPRVHDLRPLPALVSSSGGVNPRDAKRKRDEQIAREHKVLPPANLKRGDILWCFFRSDPGDPSVPSDIARTNLKVWLGVVEEVSERGCRALLCSDTDAFSSREDEQAKIRWLQPSWKEPPPLKEARRRLRDAQPENEADEVATITALEKQLAVELDATWKPHVDVAEWRRPETLAPPLGAASGDGHAILSKVLKKNGEMRKSVHKNAVEQLEIIHKIAHLGEW